MRESLERTLIGAGLILAVLLVMSAPMWLMWLCCLFVLVVYFMVDYRNGYAALERLEDKQRGVSAERKLAWLAGRLVVGTILTFVLMAFYRDFFFVSVGTIMATDIFAWFFGSMISRLSKQKDWRIVAWLATHPTEISKNKTVGGFLFGFLGGVAAGAALLLLSPGANPAYPLAMNIALLAAVSVCSMWGDLNESEVKRELKIKDFANYLGPHGCLSSRLDSITAGMLFPGAILLIRLFLP